MSIDGIVLLHGFTGSPRSWDAVLACLNPDVPVHRPALLGHGAPVSSVRTFDDEVDRLANGVADAGFERALLVGYSMGGRLALGLLVRHPRCFERAVLVGAHPGMSNETERQERIDQDERWAQLLLSRGTEAFVHQWERLPLFATQEGAPPDARSEQRRIRSAHEARGLARALRVLGTGSMPDYAPALGGVLVPTRFLVGERDSKFRALGETMATAWGGPAEVVVVPAAGHNLPLEHPAKVAEIMART